MELWGIRTALVAPVAVYALATLNPAFAQSKAFNVPAQSAVTGIPELARQADVQILVSESAVRGKTVKSVRGTMSVEEALRRLLSGTGLHASSSDGRTFLLAGSDAFAGASAGSASNPSLDTDIVVTGSRIRGAESPSPIVEIGSAQIRQAGYTDLGQVIRSIPQNFAGGQNPGLGINAGGLADQDATGGSSFDLRGLGPDATLALFNGRRLAYDGFNQGVDISAIPIAAVDRVEIVTDGASAIYGSDAVAGVANIILKRRYDGLTTTALIGGATDGGLVTKDVSVTGGKTWQTGDILLAYDFQDGTNIRSSQRSYLGYLDDRLDIYPALRHNSAVLSAHQEFSSGISFQIDALFSDRLEREQSTYFDVVSQNRNRTQSLSIAPSIDFELPFRWKATLSGVYSTDKTHFSIVSPTFDSTGCYCDNLKTGELNAEGPLFKLPGGDVRAAIGAGYRDSGLEALSMEPTLDLVSKYAYGEVSIPLVSPDLHIPMINRLALTAAGRYETYQSVGSVGTPKFGLIYDPAGGISLKGTWGKSFKAPTIEQLRSLPYVFAYSATEAGGTGYPAGATVLLPNGGGQSLQPERATSWTGTLSIHPPSIPGLKVEATYFNVLYRDRIIQPIDNLFIALSSSQYDPFITLNPSPALVSAITSKPGVLFYNESGGTFDPANVAAIIDDRYTNIARQHLSGVDLSAEYAFTIAGGRADLSESASWLRGSQTNGPGDPEFSIVGIGGRPAKFRMRLGASWAGSRLEVASFLNVTGSVFENRFDPVGPTGKFATVDLTLHYRLGSPNPKSGVTLGLSVQNLFNTAPPQRAVPYNFVLDYDSTNYSAIGRFVSFSLTKSL